MVRAMEIYELIRIMVQRYRAEAGAGRQALKALAESLGIRPAFDEALMLDAIDQ